MMLMIGDFRNQNIDNTPYSEEQIEFLLKIRNMIDWPWQCFACDNVSISKEKSAIGDAYVLKINDLCYMTTFPVDILDHRSIYEIAHGHVLLTGLGLGLGVLFACHNHKVNSITVVENNSVVLSKIASILVHKCNKSLRFIEHDANTWQPDMHFNFAYIDHCACDRADSERYIKYSDLVINWHDERVKLESTWR